MSLPGTSLDRPQARRSTSPVRSTTDKPNGLVELSRLQHHGGIARPSRPIIDQPKWRSWRCGGNCCIRPSRNQRHRLPTTAGNCYADDVFFVPKTTNAIRTGQLTNATVLDMFRDHHDGGQQLRFRRARWAPVASSPAM